MGAKWKEGVCAAIKEYGKPLTSEMADDELIQFAIDGFQGLTQDENDVEALCRKLPPFVKLVLISRKYVEWKRIDRPKNVGNLKTFSSFKEMINSLCIACYCYKPQYDHPLYEGKVCYDCYDKLKNTINVLDDEGLYIFCFICGNSSKVHSCIQQNCQRIYCTPCIQNLMKKKKIGKYLECNLCTPSNENTIIRKSDWLYQMQVFFHPTIKTVHLRTMYDVKRVMFIVCDNLHGFEKIFPHYHKIPFKSIEKGIFGLYSCKENSSFPDYRIFWDTFQEKDDFTLNDYCNVDMDKINELGPTDLLMGGLSLNEKIFS
ncbi:PREDICTED: DNA (cytosine-5)-methyltransferase 3B-like [Nicrophorus vespilloides]|uniref:DNA (Cytosine-5)-methyltransferase 3B-like n=1 Tax=Nicrophorus vespilloides TaxID=110193 RepID=A0ABM1MPB3_NICVS|nr:PREDICTED: DNA (cytosine-5)-methyltransferase 3B-like [Nicrophorus vespilloides]